MDALLLSQAERLARTLGASQQVSESQDRGVPSVSTVAPERRGLSLRERFAKKTGAPISASGVGPLVRAPVSQAPPVLTEAPADKSNVTKSEPPSSTQVPDESKASASLSLRAPAPFVSSVNLTEDAADIRFLHRFPALPSAAATSQPKQQQEGVEEDWQTAAINKQSFSRPPRQSSHDMQDSDDDLWDVEPTEQKLGKPSAARQKPRKRLLPQRHSKPSASTEDSNLGNSDSALNVLSDADELETQPQKRSRKHVKHAAVNQSVDDAAAEGKTAPQKRKKADSTIANVKQEVTEEENTDVIAAEFVVPARQSNEPRTMHGTLGDGSTESLVLSGVTAQGKKLELHVPASINGHLRAYQRAGVQFFFRQYCQGKGGVLADDMGLGKTVQTISFFAALLGKTGNLVEDAKPCTIPTDKRRAPILLVCPASVLSNWQRELNQWGAFKAAKLHGSTKDSAAGLQGVKDGTTEILLTTFDTYRIRVADLTKIRWHVAVFDEAHKLKNDESLIYQAAQMLPTKLRYGLTGTAMQNDFKELWALLHWIAPDDFRDHSQFEAYYTMPLKLGQQRNASEHHLGKADPLIDIHLGRQRAQQLNEQLARFMLRRTKAIITDLLPQKQDNIVFCQLSELQLRAYKRTLDSPDYQALMHWSPELAMDQGILWAHFHLCDCEQDECKRHKPDGCAGRMHCPGCLSLPALMILRKISNHLEMIKVDPVEDSKDWRRLQRAKEVAEMVLGEDANQVGGLCLETNWLAASDTSACGKLKTLERLLDKWKETASNKVLVFSHSVRMLKIIREVIVRRGYVFSWLDGSTPVKDRQRLCDAFNAQPSTFLFLISTTAGGLGLNLTAANKVVIIDPSWNPAHDLQAQDRAFRIGQTRDVSVYRLIATGTMEEMIYTRQIYKQQQTAVAMEGTHERRYFEGVQGVPDMKGELWGIGNLLKLTADRLETQSIIAAQRKGEDAYHIEECDMHELANVGPTLKPQGGEEAADDLGMGQLAGRMAQQAQEPGPDASQQHPTPGKKAKKAGKKSRADPATLSMLEG